MIGRLTGRVVEDGGDGTLVVDVGGVGYEVLTPLGTLGRSSDPEHVTLFVHTHVREDALLLYGFATRDDRAAFRTLISISNIGPKIAIGILGALTAAALAEAVTRRDTGKLTAIPGVGKKTAERILLELKDKLTGVGAPVSPPAGAARAPEGKGELLLGALTRMGFRPVEAERAVAALGDRVATGELGDLVREALALLSR